VPSGKLVGKLEGHQGLLVSAAFSPDGEQVVTTSEDDTARLWDVRSLRTLRILRGHKDDLTHNRTSGSTFAFSRSNWNAWLPQLLRRL
jgi:WD40 repeat protein